MPLRYTIQATTSTFTVLAQVLSLLLATNEDLFYLLISNLAEDSRLYILISRRAFGISCGFHNVDYCRRVKINIASRILLHVECLFYIRIQLERFRRLGLYARRLLFIR